jgi:hypothetical protein
MSETPFVNPKGWRARAERAAARNVYETSMQPLRNQRDLAVRRARVAAVLADKDASEDARRKAADELAFIELELAEAAAPPDPHEAQEPPRAAKAAKAVKSDPGPTKAAGASGKQ